MWPLKYFYINKTFNFPRGDPKDKIEKEIIMAKEIFTVDRDLPKILNLWLSWIKSGDKVDRKDANRNITLSSLWGISGGDALAVVLGKRAGFYVWDRDLINSLVKDKESREAVLATLTDEQKSVVDERAKIILTASASEDEEIVNQMSMVAALAAHGRSIFLEVGGNYLLTSEEALNIRLVPKSESAIDHHAKRNELELDDAKKELVQKERELKSFISNTFGEDIGDPAYYDMILNSGTLNLFDAVELVIKCYESKFSPSAGWWHI